MTAQSEVVLFAWGLLAVACIWARVLDALDARARRLLVEVGARNRLMLAYRPPTKRQARALYRAARRRRL